MSEKAECPKCHVVLSVIARTGRCPNCDRRWAVYSEFMGDVPAPNTMSRTQEEAEEYLRLVRLKVENAFTDDPDMVAYLQDALEVREVDPS